MRNGSGTYPHEKVLLSRGLRPEVEEPCARVRAVSRSLARRTGTTLRRRVVSPGGNRDHGKSRFPSGKPVRPARPFAEPALQAPDSARLPAPRRFYAIKKVFKDAIYPSDIGCYTLGSSRCRRHHHLHGSVDHGRERHCGSGEKRDVVCTIGDSTFLHTGIQGLMNAVYNGANMTVVILDNRITAMTGHQPNPNSGQPPAVSRRPVPLMPSAVPAGLLCRDGRSL